MGPVGSLGQVLRSLRANRRLLKDFVVRDLRARYVGSSMGFFWSVVFPIVNLVVYMYVFRIILHMRFQDDASTADMGIWMLAGITVWAAFAETLSRSANCLVENSNLIQKVVFPSEVLPVYLASSSLVNMCIGMPIVLLAVVWVAYISPSTEVDTAVAALQDVHIKAKERSMVRPLLCHVGVRRPIVLISMTWTPEHALRTNAGTPVSQQKHLGAC